jgi:KAP family P-loop domain
MNPMQDVARHFGWLIAKVKRPVVFFIDDLDRCPDSYVVELLEAVQTLIRDPAERNEKLGGAVLPAFVVGR